MPILLGLESAALAAAAYKWTPRAREKAKDWYGYAKQYLVSENEAKIAVQPAAEPEGEGEEDVGVLYEMRQVFLPELRGDPEHAERSVLRHKEVLETLDSAVPRRYGGEVGGQWHLLFTTSVDGTSLSHMLRTVASDAALLLVVRSGGRVFGAFVPELRDPHAPSGDRADSARSSKDGLALGGLGGLAAHSRAGSSSLPSSSAASSASFSGGGGGGYFGASAFYGSGESLLFALAELRLPPPPEAQRSSPSPSGGRRAGGAKVFAYTYRWTPGANSHFVRSDAEGLYFGSGGSGGVGLALQNPLTEGRSGHCDTYDNQPLPLVATPLTQVMRDLARANLSRNASSNALAGSGAEAHGAASPAAAASGRGGGGVGGRGGGGVGSAPLDVSDADEPPHTPIAGARTEEEGTPQPSSSTTSTPAGASGGTGGATHFELDCVEVWALDPRACRSMKACASHVRIEPHG
jgi:hypothetical protein